MPVSGVDLFWAAIFSKTTGDTIPSIPANIRDWTPELFVDDTAIQAITQRAEQGDSCSVRYGQVSGGGSGVVL